jgi:hypothetical protein
MCWSSAAAVVEGPIQPTEHLAAAALVVIYS